MKVFVINLQSRRSDRVECKDVRTHKASLSYHNNLFN